MPWWLVLLVAGCGRSHFDLLDDAGAVPRCDLATPFGAPQVLQGLHQAGAYDSTITLVRDELTAFFYSNRSGNDDLFIATRADLGSIWTGAAMPSVNSAFDDNEPGVAPDGGVLVFASTRPPSASADLWLAQPQSPGNYAVIGSIADLDSAGDEVHPFFQLDGTDFWFGSARSGSMSLYHSTYLGGTSFTPPVELAELDVANGVNDAVVVTEDGLGIYFRTSRPGANGNDIWFARRTTVDQPFSNAAPVAELNSSAADTPNWISPDNCRLYMSSGRDDPSVLYVATRVP